MVTVHYITRPVFNSFQEIQQTFLVSKMIRVNELKKIWQNLRLAVLDHHLVRPSFLRGCVTEHCLKDIGPVRQYVLVTQEVLAATDDFEIWEVLILPQLGHVVSEGWGFLQQASTELGDTVLHGLVDLQVTPVTNVIGSSNEWMNEWMNEKFIILSQKKLV